MQQIVVGLVQINNSFSGQNYLPYSIACLQSYAQARASDPARYRFLEMVYKRAPAHTIVDAVQSADVVGFSTYVWNIRISLEVARRLKAQRPGMVIVFGGPQVPNDAEAFLRANPQVDVAVHGEGERTFLALLEQLGSGGGIDGIAGTSRIDAAAHFVSVPGGARLHDLDELPSPFLNGLFDGLIDRHPEEKWIGLWETNRGCPFKCSYCDWGSAVAAKVTKFGVDRLMAEADWISDREIEYVFVCDANFGMLARDLDIVHRVAAGRDRTGYPHGFSVQNTKNATERAYAVQKVLADAKLNKGVALSMQSLNQEALKNIRRDNIDLEGYIELQTRFTKDGIETFSDLILGLPGETHDSFVEGLDALLESGQHNRIQFNNCSILPNAEMADPAYLARFAIETVETDIVNIHGSKAEMDDDVAEKQVLIIATSTLPRADWCRTRGLAWMAALLHFDKLLQIPVMAVRHLVGMRYRDIFDAFMGVDARRHPLLGEIRDFFLAEAANIQAGSPEYVFSEEWLGIYWPADEHVFIRLTAEGRLDRFYEEAGALLEGLCRDAPADTRLAVAEAVRLNRVLVHQPFQGGTVAVDMACDMLAFAQQVREGAPQPPAMAPVRIVIDREGRRYDDFQKWCREIVWWGNKKGAYLYSGAKAERQLAGHF